MPFISSTTREPLTITLTTAETMAGLSTAFPPYDLTMEQYTNDEATAEQVADTIKARLLGIAETVMTYAPCENYYEIVLKVTGGVYMNYRIATASGLAENLAIHEEACAKDLRKASF